jgi:hypothetical protein
MFHIVTMAMFATDVIPQQVDRDRRFRRNCLNHVDVPLGRQQRGDIARCENILGHLQQIRKVGA